MADDELEIKLTTKADVSGADQAKDAIDGVKESVKTAAEEQSAGSAEVTDALKKESDALAELKQKAAERLEASKQESEANDAVLESLKALSEATAEYNEALVSGDQEAAVEALAKMRENLGELAAETEELPPEFQKLNAELDELEQQVAGKKSFKKLSNQANGAAKSLSKIEKLQVAEAIGNIVSQSRSAGAGLANMAKDGESAVDTALNATEAVGGLVGSVASGFAAGGPIGAGIALVTAGLSFFSEKMAESKKEISDALGSGLEEGFKRSKASIQESTVALKAFTDQQDIAKRNHDAELEKIQNIVDLELQRARNNAEINNLDRELRKVKILGNDKLNAEEKENELAKLEIEKINEEAELKKKEIEISLDGMQKQIEQLKTEKKSTVEKRDELLETRDPKEIDQVIENATKRRDKAQKTFNLDYGKLDDLLDSATTFGPLSNNKYEDPIKDRLQAYKKADDKSLKARLSLFDDLLAIVKQAPEKKIEGDKDATAFKSALERLINDGGYIEKTDGVLDSLSDAKQQAEAKLKKFETRIKALENKVADAELDKSAAESQGVLEREKIKIVREKKIEITSERRDQSVEKLVEKREKKEATEQKKAEAKAARKAKKAEADILKAARKAAALAKDKDLEPKSSLRKKGDRRKNSGLINDAERVAASLEDGASDSEVQDLYKLIGRLAAAIKSTTGTNSPEAEQLRQTNTLLKGALRDIEQLKREAKYNRPKGR